MILIRPLNDNILLVQVWDKDTLSSDNLGVVEIDITSFKQSGSFEGWFDITESLTDKTITGAVKLKFNLVKFFN